MYEDSVVWRKCLYDSSTSLENGVYVMTVSYDENVCMKQCLLEDGVYMTTVNT